MRGVAAAVMLLVLMTSGAIKAGSEGAGGTRRGAVLSLEEQRRRELMIIALELKEAILRQDKATILKYVAKDGILCGDAMVPYAEVKRGLEDPTSRFYADLFDTERLRQFVAGRTLYPPESVKEYLEKARDLTIEINFFKVGGKKRLDWAGITYTSRHSDVLPPPNVDLFRRKGRWMFNSFFNALGTSC